MRELAFYSMKNVMFKYLHDHALMILYDEDFFFSVCVIPGCRLFVCSTCTASYTAIDVSLYTVPSFLLMFFTGRRQERDRDQRRATCAMHR